MVQVTFQYLLGGNKPFETLKKPVKDDADAYKQIDEFLAAHPGATIVDNSVEWFHVESRILPYPPPASQQAA